LTHYLLLSIFTKLILSLGNLGIGIRTSAMVLSGLATVLIGIAIHKVIEKPLVSRLQTAPIMSKA
ncbi:MAG: hypothetical protein AAF289_13550, partial [Cyanobacteria bacterium P01_A01_bin.135]